MVTYSKLNQNNVNYNFKFIYRNILNLYIEMQNKLPNFNYDIFKVKLRN